MTIKEALKIIGGLSQTTKMPCPSWGIPAEYCKTGSRLARIEGTPCSVCYANRNRYAMPNVRGANERRLNKLTLALTSEEGADRFVQAFVHILNRRKLKHFRWFDTGDLQSIDHLFLISDICWLTPDTKHWLPTQERAMVNQFINRADMPPNLTIRISSPNLNRTWMGLLALGLPSSWVSSNPDDVTCPAGKQGHQCLDCRACWDPNVKEVCYEQI